MLQPTAAAIVAAQNRRSAQFEDLHVTGQAELRWTHDGRNRFEYCRVELFWRPQAWTGVSLTKAGERFLWLGSDPEHFWVFDLASDPTRAVIGRHEQMLAAERAPLGLRPLGLIDLLGVSTVEAAGETVWWSGEDQCWGVIVRGLAGPFELHVDPATMLPRRTYQLSPTGERLLVCDLGEEATVEAVGVGPAESPKFPLKVTLRRVGAGSGDGQDRIDLFLTEPRGRSAVVKDGLFDLDRLKRLLKPEVIEGAEVHEAPIAPASEPAA